MPYKVIISNNALNNVEAIISYISQDNPYRAISFTKELLGKVKSILEVFPLSGRKYKERRLLVYSGYYVFYKVDEKNKEVWLSEIINPAHYTAYENLIN
ncbi:MAG: type II toxin-antitoxin system RelE/ParE family toxin [Pseudomonadota bacterium]